MLKYISSSIVKLLIVISSISKVCSGKIYIRSPFKTIALFAGIFSYNSKPIWLKLVGLLKPSSSKISVFFPINPVTL
jgi:hypothetical protein